MKKTIKKKVASHGTQKKIEGLAAKVAKVDSKHLRSDLPQYSAGDTVRVHVRIKEGEKERIQVYEGVVIARRNSAVGRSFIVRKISHGVGVERIFLESSPKVAKLEVVSSGKVRRAKLYYLRGLEGKAAKLEREVETQAAAEAKAAAKQSKGASASK